MQLETLHDHGQVTVDRPVRLAKERFSVIPEIPYTAPIPDADAPTRETSKHLGDADGKRVLEEIRQILGPLSKTRAPVGSTDDNSALSEALAEKYGQSNDHRNDV